MSESNQVSNFVGVLPRTIKLAERVIILLESGLAGEPNGEWVQLDATGAAHAVEDLDTLKREARSLLRALEQASDGGSSKVAFLDRVENTFEYTGATICLNPDGKAEAHVGRAGSAVRQMRGLITQAREHVLSVLSKPAHA